MRRIVPNVLRQDSDLQWTLAVAALVGVFLVASILSPAFPWVLFFVSMVGAAAAICIRPRIGLFVLLLLTMLFERFFTLQGLDIGGHTVKLYPFDLLLGVTFVAALVDCIRTRHRGDSFLITFAWFEKLLLVFAALATLYFFESQLAQVREPDIAFSTFKNYALYPIITFLILALIRTKEHFRTLMRVVLAGGVGILVFFHLGLLNGVGLWTEYTPLSTEGVRYLSFPHAFYLMIALLIGAGALVHKQIRYPRRFAFLLGLFVVGILASLMRHLWIALLVGGAILMLLAPRAVKKNVIRFGQYPVGALLLLGLVLVVAALFAPGSFLGTHAAAYLDPFVARIASFRNITEDLSALWRLELWKAAAGLFVAHPLFGTGYGREVTFTVLDWTSTVRLRELHNSLFGLLVQMGVVGVAVFAACMGTLVAGFFRARRQTHPLQPWADGAFAATGAFLVASLFQPYFETNILGIAFWFLIGMVRVAPEIYVRAPINRGQFRRFAHHKILESTPRSHQ